MPLENRTREQVWPLHANYIFFDRENHFLIVSVHTAIASFSFMCLHLGQAMNFAISIEHISGLFAVVR